MARTYDVAVMHDYFVDRLLHTKKLEATMSEIGGKAESGGGGLHGYRQEEIGGGNAVNLANSLARLGLKTLLITHSERAHEHLLLKRFAGTTAEVRIKRLPAGLTVAFEGKVNVMLSDGRGASEFGPSELDARDWLSLENSRIVCSVNWAANRKGTDLLVALRKRLGTGKTIFIDPADFRDRPRQFKELVGAIVGKGLVDWVSMNEFESLAAANALDLRFAGRGQRCKALAKEMKVVFDMHCEDASFSSEGTRVSSARTRVLKSVRLTGAGDVWDAASIYGRLNGMDEVPRLKFANKAARLYLERADPIPPTLSQVEVA